jgi:hypothetical protein
MEKITLKTTRFGIIFAAFIGGANAADINLLTNSGFESGDFVGWSVSGNAQSGVASDGAPISGAYYSDNAVNVHSGSYAAWAKVATSTSPTTSAIFSQTISITPNSSYDVGFWLSIGSQISSAGRNYSINVNGQNILQVYTDGHWPEDSWVGFSPTNYLHEHAIYTSGVSETSAKVDFILSGSGTAFVGFSYDDFHFTGPSPVPLPASAGMFGGALLGLSLKFRRHIKHKLFSGRCNFKP